MKFFFTNSNIPIKTTATDILKFPATDQSYRKIIQTKKKITEFILGDLGIPESVVWTHTRHQTASFLLMRCVNADYLKSTLLTVIVESSEMVKKMIGFRYKMYPFYLRA